MPRTQLVARGGLAMMLGGVLWIALRPLVASAWGKPIFGLSYEDYNRLMVAPLLLLLAGVLAFRRSVPAEVGRAARWGLAFLALGVATSLDGGAGHPATRSQGVSPAAWARRPAIAWQLRGQACETRSW